MLHYYQYGGSIGTSESKHLFCTVQNAVWQAINVLIVAYPTDGTDNTVQ
jgi:hypothetical protein